MFKVFPLQVALNHLYILQLEEYIIARYLNVIRKTGGISYSGMRKGIDWTKKLFLINTISFLLHFLVNLGVTWLIFTHASPAPLFIFVVIFIVLYALTSYLYFVFLTFTTALLKPVDLYLKNKIMKQAVEKIKLFPNLKVIGVAGSYGKTTMKELLYSILSQKYKVLKTPKSINTPLGISRQIIKELDSSIEFYVVEMGEYYKGDVKTLCELTKPDIAVVTGINESHLERMGTLEVTTATIFEVVQNCKENGRVMLNVDDTLVSENYHKYLGNRHPIFYSFNTQFEDMKISDIKFHEDASGISFHLSQRDLDIGTFKIGLLGEYIIADIIGCIQLAQELGLSITEISQGIQSMKPVEHRLQPIYNKHTHILVIDDSYNGNVKGVEEAIKVLARFPQQRRIYVTPGLAEAGSRAKDINYTIGIQLAPVAGIVVLIRNSVTLFIAQALEDSGFDKENIMWFDSAKEAHKALPQIVRAYDVVLFQNDWPDNYI